MGTLFGRTWWLPVSFRRTFTTRYWTRSRVGRNERADRYRYLDDHHGRHGRGDAAGNFTRPASHLEGVDFAGKTGHGPGGGRRGLTRT